MLNKERALTLLNTIMELELASVVRYTLMVYGPNRIPTTEQRPAKTLSPLPIALAASLMCGWGLAAHAQTAAPVSDNKEITLPAVSVIEQREGISRAPGSVSVLDKQTLEDSRVFTVNEALRKLPGVHVRDEEGFGLRPNIGIRGLNPTRSTKITLLEDGIPLAYAPYGDNASYYFPPVERFDIIELVKGVGTLAYGPQTIGGVINFRTPAPTRELSGFVQATGGSRSLADVKARISANGMLLDFTHKEGKGARDNTSSDLNDLNFKLYRDIGGGHSLTGRLSYFTEDSQVTYSGLTTAELAQRGPRYNPFKNDVFEIKRSGASLTHRMTMTGGTNLTTSLYYAHFDRDWWRQSSTTTDTQCGTAFRDARLAGNAVNVDACNSVQGRLRKYDTVGIDSRLKFALGRAGFMHNFEAGVKLHNEEQDRRQVNGASPTARTGTLSEDNLRQTKAASLFVSDHIEIGENITLTPIVRYEYIDSSRRNRLPGGLAGSDTLGKLIPGVGSSWRLSSNMVAFAGVHRGFAPPRTEDIIAGSGTSTEVGAEESTNSELGLRYNTLDGFSAQASVFRNDFKRLIAVGSIAGGATPLAEGQALFQGIELSGSWYSRSGPFVTAALTLLPTAEQSTPFRKVLGGTLVAGSMAGNRQPYAPKQTTAVTVGWQQRDWLAQLEAVHIGAQFADFANTLASSADGQSGQIVAQTTFNAALNYHFNRSLTVFATVKNLTNKAYIVDRTRGIQTSSPQLAQVGLRWTY